MTVGSGLWSKQTPTKDHLIDGPGGIAKEVQDVRLDLAAALQPLVGVAIEEYVDPPAAVATAIMLVTAREVGTVKYQYAGLTGSVGAGAISPPRNIEVVTAGSTATQAPTSVTVTGFDAQGNALTEVITGTAAGAGTYVGVKCFAKVTQVTFTGGTGTGATISVGTGIVIGLSYIPKTRSRYGCHRRIRRGDSSRGLRRRHRDQRCPHRGGHQPAVRCLHPRNRANDPGSGRGLGLYRHHRRRPLR